ncbi:MAG: ABC transporter permease subunit [Thermogladius sp.]|nr:ABC transporter permease subunit [Thermogladius sp.]
MKLSDALYVFSKIVSYITLFAIIAYIFLVSFVPVIGAFALKWEFSILPEVWTLNNIKFLLEDPFVLRSLYSSLLIASITSVVSVTIYLLVIMFLFLRERSRWVHTFVEVSVLIPLMLPAILIALAIYEVYRPTMLGGTYWILVFAHLTIVSPYVFRNLYSVARMIDMKTLIEAARSLGAGVLTATYRVILPNIYHGLIGAMLLAFAVSFGDFEMANLLAPWQYRTVTIAIFQYFFKNAWNASAIILLVIIVSVLTSFLVAYLSRKALARYVEVVR